MSEVVLEKRIETDELLDKLCREMIETRFMRQLEFDAPQCQAKYKKILDEGQLYEESAHPGFFAIPSAIFYEVRLVAALAGAGFSRGPEIPAGLLEQIDIDISNESSEFLRLIEGHGGESYSSYKVRVLKLEAIKAVLEFAYCLGESSKISYEESLLEHEEDTFQQEPEEAQPSDFLAKALVSYEPGRATAEDVVYTAVSLAGLHADGGTAGRYSELVTVAQDLIDHDSRLKGDT